MFEHEEFSLVGSCDNTLNEAVNEVIERVSELGAETIF